MNKYIKWSAIILASPFVLFLIVTLLLYLPPVQNLVVGIASDYASEATGMKISIGRVNLGFPLDLKVKRVDIVENTDTLFKVDDMRIDVQLLPLFKNKVEIDAVEIKGVKLNTKEMVEAARVKGHIDYLYMNSHGIELEPETAVITQANMKDAYLDVCINDTLPEDTATSEPTYWKVMLEKVKVENVRMRLTMVSDSLFEVTANLADANMTDGILNLKDTLYTINKVMLADGGLTYKSAAGEPKRGFDPGHIQLDKINLQVDSIEYNPRRTALNVSRCSFSERSGLKMDSLMCKFWMDSTSIHLPEAMFRTPDSYGDAIVDFDLNSFEKGSGGRMYARFRASLGKQDVITLAGENLPENVARHYPNVPFNLRANVDGNADAMDITGIYANMKGCLEAKGKAHIRNVMEPEKMYADAEMTATTGNLKWISAIMPDVMGDYNLPDGMTLDAHATADMTTESYNAKGVFTEGGGRATFDALYNGKSESYTANLDIKDINVHHFMPKEAMYTFSGNVEARGKGTDVYSAATHAEAKAHISKLHYDKYHLDKIDFNATYANNHYKVSADTDNKLIAMKANAEGDLKKDFVSADMDVDLRKVDFLAMDVVEDPLDAGMKLKASASTDMKDMYQLQASVNDMYINTEKTSYYPQDFILNAYADADTTYASASSGDMKLGMHVSGGLMALSDQCMKLGEIISDQLEKKRIDQNELRRAMPLMDLKLEMGNNNPVSNLLAINGYSFGDFRIRMNTSPEKGLNGKMHIYSIDADSMQIDTVRLVVSQDTTSIKFRGLVENGPKNKQFVFKAKLDGEMVENGAKALVALYDDKDKLAIKLGAQVGVVENGYLINFYPSHPTLGYREFKLNDDNFILISGERYHVDAKVELLANDGTGLKLYSTPDSEYWQDLTLDVSHLQLGDITSSIPYCPYVTGDFNGSFHAMVNSETDFSVASDIDVHNMTYEECPIGNIGAEFVYLPKGEDGHYVDGRMMKDGVEVATVKGTYYNTEAGDLDLTARFYKFPLSIVNGFIPDHMCAFDGTCGGSLDITGNLNRPIVNGSVELNKATLSSALYGFNFKFDDTPVKIENSVMKFEDFNVYSFDKNPFKINGDINFVRTDKIRVNMRMGARNFTLVSAKRNINSMVYGKVVVDFFCSVKGVINDLVVRGYLNVQGNTDVTYVLRDTPLTVEDRLADLVVFEDFSDTNSGKKIIEEDATIFGMDMLLNIQMEQGAQIKCDISADRQSYINLEGGGNLVFQYTPQGQMILTGRYTLNNGEMKYALPVIPLKTFTIQNGSYIEWTGDVFNPTLYFMATERVKATVTDGETPRSVAFDVGVKVTNTLENMGLEFTLAAPEDNAVQNELNAMTSAQRGKLAVSMLATGLYLAEGNNSNFSMSNAMNSFLQSEINNIAGNALQTMDISLGMEDHTGADGQMHTDYSFRFAKRFWNNRVSIVIGGKISSDNNTDAGQSFIDDVAIEYRLDNSGTRVVRLFHDQVYDNMLEGQLTENGAGLVLRKKMDKFSELFIFKNTKKNAPMPQRPQQNGSQQMRRNEPSASEEPKPAATKKEEEQNEAEKK